MPHHHHGTADPRSGRPGFLDAGQQHLVKKMREEWDFPAAKEMMMEAETWRRSFKVDELYETFTFPEQEAVEKIYPKYYHKTDKDGRPVYVEQLTNLDLTKLFKVTTPERLIQQLVYDYEKCQRERLPVCSAVKHDYIETSCTIMDLKNVGVGQFWKVSSYVQQASKIGQSYYPETMGRFYIINSPYIFTTVWAVIKNWLDPVTRDKIQILGSNYLPELAKQIPLENIPASMGGKCQCPGGCSLSDAGPWKTPEGEELVRREYQRRAKIAEDYRHGQDDNVVPAHAVERTRPATSASVSDSPSAPVSGSPSAPVSGSPSAPVSGSPSVASVAPSASTSAASSGVVTPAQHSSHEVLPPVVPSALAAQTTSDMTSQPMLAPPATSTSGQSLTRAP